MKVNLILKGQLQAMVAGLKTHFSPKQTVLLDGVSVHVSDVIKQYETFITLLDAIATANDDWRRLVQRQRGAALSIKMTTTGLRGLEANRFGESSKTFGEFGFQPRKASKRTFASKVHAIEKERATKASRHVVNGALVNGLANGAANGSSHA